jgi:hypothetical protein
MYYFRYLVKDNDQFDPLNFPQIEEDLDTIIVSMSQMPTSLNSEILLSFTKDHSMQSSWVSANPALAEMISSKSLPVANLEALFASCTRNLSFRRQLEEYVTHRFKTATNI